MEPQNNNNILLFTSEYPPQIGGVASYYRDLVATWNEAGKNEIKVLHTRLTPHWLIDIFRLWHAVRRFNNTTVLVGQLLPVGTVTWLLSKVIRFDYVVFVHGMDLPYALQKPRKRWLVEKIVRDAKQIIAVNSFVQKMLEDNFSDVAHKIAVINPGVALTPTLSQKEREVAQQLRNQYDLADKKVLLQIGRLVKRKGVDKVLEALPQAVEQCPDLLYVIVGDGKEVHNIKRKMQHEKLKGKTVLITDATDEEVHAWYELCNIFIMPARHIGGDFEGFGIVYLEANAHGKPVIAGDSGGVRDAVEDGVNGLLVDPENVDEIADAIVKLGNDKELRKKLGERGRERVREFVWEKQVGKLHSVVRAIKKKADS